jgi:hypothetical protein
VPSHRTILIAIAFLVIGLLAGGAAGWYSARDDLARTWVGVTFYRAASEGRLQIRILQDLRKGDTKRSIETLELLLDANLVMLAQFREEDLPKEKIEAIHAAISEIRQYREKYPRVAASPSAQEAIGKALSLKRSKQGNAP